MFHVNRVEWGPDDSSAYELQNVLNAEDEDGFYLDRIVSMVYPWVEPGLRGDDDVLEQRCELIVITGDHVLPK